MKWAINCWLRITYKYIFFVSLHTLLNDELIEEGFVREIISKVQNMRKEADFEVLDRINLYYDGNENILYNLGRFIHDSILLCPTIRHTM